MIDHDTLLNALVPSTPTDLVAWPAAIAMSTTPIWNSWLIDVNVVWTHAVQAVGFVLGIILIVERAISVYEWWLRRQKKKDNLEKQPGE